jgi:DNA-directed RNA polymerase subunit RPC12/RpoP
MAHIPCFLCGKQLDRRTDKNGKAYFVCDPCGTQIFIRRRQGIENLDDLIKALRGRDLPFREHAESLYEIQAVLIEIRGLKEEIEKLDSVLNFFRKDKDKTRTRKLLRARIDHLLLQLEKIASPRRPRREP